MSMNEREQHEADLVSTAIAASIRKRFDTIAGQDPVTSDLVFLAAKQVLVVVFGPSEDVFAALDEIDDLEERV